MNLDPGIKRLVEALKDTGYKLYSMNISVRCDDGEPSGGNLILAKRKPTPQEAAKLWWGDEDYDPETDTEVWIEVEEVSEIKILP